MLKLILASILLLGLASCWLEDADMSKEQKAFLFKLFHGKVDEFGVNPILYNDVMNGTDGIHGGSSASLGQYPWQVAMLNAQNRQFCGGTIISPTWVLSAAHCIQNGGRYKALAGSLSSSPGSGQVRDSTRVIRHPQYGNLNNDYALMQVSSPFSLNNNVAVLPIATSGDGSSAVGNAVSVSGWGQTESGRPSNVLLYTDVTPIVSNQECASKMGRATASMICAGPVAGGNSPCFGDSGGPLTGTASNGEKRLVGAVSWGKNPCGQRNAYGVYARVEHVTSWIQGYVSDKN